MDAEGNVLITQGQRSVPAFEESRVKLQGLMDVRTQIAALGDGKKEEKAKLERSLLLAEIDLQIPKAEDAKKRAEALGLGKDDMAIVDRYAFGAELRALRGKTRELGADAVAAQVAEMAKAGKLPTKDTEAWFWQMSLTYAAKNADGELGQKAFDALSKLSIPEPMKKRLEAMLDQSKGK
jgi:hypothetical protein